MNFLAHIYLSGTNDFVKIGNFMADGIRGKNYESFLPDIQKGIFLHRAIDTFTDAHPIFRESTKRLHPKFHHYAGIIVDIFYDYFLSKHWERYSIENRPEFIQKFYQSLLENQLYLNDSTKLFYPQMISENWLLRYESLNGIAHTLQRMEHRIKNQSKLGEATQMLEENYTFFELEFLSFFEDIQLHCNKIIEKWK